MGGDLTSHGMLFKVLGNYPLLPLQGYGFDEHHRRAPPTDLSCSSLFPLVLFCYQKNSLSCAFTCHSPLFSSGENGCSKRQPHASIADLLNEEQLSVLTEHANRLHSQASNNHPEIDVGSSSQRWAKGSLCKDQDPPTGGHACG